MKNYSLKKCFQVLLFVLSAGLAHATHNRSGEILYRRVAPFTQQVNGVTVPVYTYSITVVKYTDDGPNVADRCVDTVYFGDGTKGIAPRINGGTSAGCSCGTMNGNAISCGALIINKPGYRVKYNEYSILHTYQSAGTYLIRSNDPVRNPGIHNIPNSGSTLFCLEALLIIDSQTGSNSSPELTNPPVDQATMGVCFYHNMGAIDADGDSLSYEITACRDEHGAIPGYSFPETSTTFSINPVTGLLSWCGPLFSDTYAIALIVKEWRKNSSGVYRMLGYVLRDMEVIVKYGIVGIKEQEALSRVKLSPNPFSETLAITAETTEPVKITIYSGDGKLVAEQVKEGEEQSWELGTQALAPGVYIACIRIGEGLLYRKIVKE